MLVVVVGLVGYQVCYYQGVDLGNCGDQVDVQVDLVVEEVGDVGWQVEYYVVYVYLDGEVDQVEFQYLVVVQSVEEVVWVVCLFVGVFFGQFVFQCLFLFVVQLVGIVWVVDQVEVGGNVDQ